MITLRENVSISAPFEKLDAWADNFEEEFVKWSPLHLECQLFDKGINKGDRVRFFEIVMGLDYDVTGTIIESERDRIWEEEALKKERAISNSLCDKIKKL